jgi:hypothetical protein
MLGRICFFVIILGLIALVCLPVTGNVRETIRDAVVIGGVIWTAIQFVDNNQTSERRK